MFFPVCRKIQKRFEEARNSGAVILYLRFPKFRYFSRPADFPSRSPSELKLLISHSLDSLEKSLGRPRANKGLPAILRREEIVSWLNLESTLDKIIAAVWLPVTDRDLQRILSRFTSIIA